MKDAIKENSTDIRDAKLSKLRQHLDEIIKEGRWDADEVFRNNDFSDNETFQCVVYYLAG